MSLNLSGFASEQVEVPELSQCSDVDVDINVDIIYIYTYIMGVCQNLITVGKYINYSLYSLYIHFYDRNPIVLAERELGAKIES